MQKQTTLAIEHEAWMQRNKNMEELSQEQKEKRSLSGEKQEMQKQEKNLVLQNGMDEFSFSGIRKQFSEKSEKCSLI